MKGAKNVKVSRSRRVFSILRDLFMGQGRILVVSPTIITSLHLIGDPITDDLAGNFANATERFRC